MEWRIILRVVVPGVGIILILAGLGFYIYKQLNPPPPEPPPTATETTEETVTPTLVRDVYWNLDEGQQSGDQLVTVDGSGVDKITLRIYLTPTYEGVPTVPVTVSILPGPDGVYSSCIANAKPSGRTWSTAQGPRSVSENTDAEGRVSVGIWGEASGEDIAEVQAFNQTTLHKFRVDGIDGCP